MAKYVKGETVVSSDDGLKNAAHARYEKITITGELANKIAGNYRKNHEGDVISNVAIVGGLLFFWPLLVGGLFGKALTMDLERYDMISCTDDAVSLALKEKYKT